MFIFISFIIYMFVSTVLINGRVCLANSVSA